MNRVQNKAPALFAISLLVTNRVDFAVCYALLILASLLFERGRLFAFREQMARRSLWPVHNTALCLHCGRTWVNDPIQLCIECTRCLGCCKGHNAQAETPNYAR